MSNDIEITTRCDNDVVIVDIKGDVTAVTGDVLEETYNKTTADGVRKILIVFDADCYINSGGIAVLIGIVSESQGYGQTIRMTGVSDHFQKIFNMVGLTRYIDIFPSEEVALEGF
jgi:anti-anti-sigma factor